MNITFSASTIAGFAVSGIIMLLIPAAVLIVWQKRTHEKLLPVLVGAAIFLVFAEGLKAIPLLPLLSGSSALSQKILSTPWLYFLIAGLAAGIFEETGRFIAFRFLLKKYPTRRTSVSYGIGHGGIEAVYCGAVTLSLIVLAFLINSGGSEKVLGDVPPEIMPLATKKLEGYASMTFAASMLGVMERISALMLQIALSVLVFRAAHNKGSLWLYPLAIVLHAAIDFTTIIADSSLLLFEAVMLLAAIMLLLAAISLIYDKMPKEQEESQ